MTAARPGGLDALARRHGIALSYVDAEGRRQRVSAATKRALLAALGVPAADAADVRTSLAEAPPALPEDVAQPNGVRCYLPDWLRQERPWGIAAQLYQLRSERNWGIGDFEDLAVLAEIAAAAGADFVGTNPLHALFIARPEHCSPFSPSSRRFLNPLYIAVDKVPGFTPEADLEPAIEKARAGELVDYAAVAEAKLAALRRIWPRWRQGGEPKAGGVQSLQEFRAERGPALDLHALFEALSCEMTAQGHGHGWQGWPEDYRDPRGASVIAFAAEKAEEVDFHAWLQWLADSQLEEARRRAREAGMRIGLYLDLAVGEAPDGSATWMDPDLMVTGASIGAPPDAFNQAGQDWGLSPPSPTALRARRLEPYRQLIADVLRHAGALRIDHVMALYRLYYVPRGMKATEGSYLRYPFSDMVAVLAEASQAARCLVIGEDLGTVPRGLRARLAEAGLHSYRVFYFEHEEGGPRPPEHYPRQALACVSTHDLMPLKGWWLGDDIRLRLELGQIDQAGARAQAADRRHDKRNLVSALAAAGRLPKGRLKEDAEGFPEDLAAALHGHLARAPSQLLAVRLEDLAGERRTVNLPGVAEGYPNWRPRLGMTLEELADCPRFRGIVEAVAAERPRKALAQRA